RVRSGQSACRLEPSALAVPVAFEYQPKPLQGQVLVVVIDRMQLGQQQGGGVSGGDHRDVVAGEPVDVLADPADQAVHQTGEAEHRTGLHALDSVLTDHRTRAGQLDPPQGGRARRRGVGGDLYARRDRTTQEFTLGGHHVHADRRAEVDHYGRGSVLLKGRETVD